MSKNRGSAIIDYENGIILIKRIKGYGQNKKISVALLSLYESAAFDNDGNIRIS